MLTIFAKKFRWLPISSFHLRNPLNFPKSRQVLAKAMALYKQWTTSYI